MPTLHSAHMERLTYEAIQRNPELLAALLRDARRERALVMGQLFAAAIKLLRPSSAPENSQQPAPFPFLRSHSRFASKG
jgi:hypothetical protein